MEVEQPTLEGMYTHVLFQSVVVIHEGRVWVGEGAKRVRRARRDCFVAALQAAPRNDGRGRNVPTRGPGDAWWRAGETYPRLALLLPHSLERVAIFLLVDEAARIVVPLDPAADLRVVGLRTVAHRPVPMAVASRWVLGHITYLPGARLAARLRAPCV